MSDGDRGAADPDLDVAGLATLPAGTLPGIGDVTRASVDVRALAQAATLPGGPGDDAVDIPIAATLPGPHAVADLPALQRIDDAAYTIGTEIARGGMGKILSARDRRLRRDVVIKVTRHDAGRIDPRFEREALITARLQHPSIVRVYEAGVLGDGRAFYAMERVRGRSLEVVLEEATTLAARIALLPHALAVVDAIAYAHNEGVLHRDLKPANVLIGPFGETVVIDWGLAKDLRATDPTSLHPRPITEPSSSDSSLTLDGSVMGTPSFMAPEQARGEPADERSDIYALGALLYTLLTGVPPHRGLTTSEVLASVAAGEHVPIGTCEPQLPPELATIVEHAMALAPADRFATAKELADELRRFAAGKLVASHAYSVWRLIKRWVRRHRFAVGVSAAAVVMLAVTAVLAVRSVVEERDKAMLAHANEELQRAKAIAALDLAERRWDELVLHQLATPVVDADPSTAAAWLTRLTDEALAWPESHALASRAAAHGISRVLTGHEGDIESVARADASHIVAAGDDGVIRLWDLASETAVVLAGHAGPVETIELSPDRKWLASGGTDGQIRLWDLATATGRVLGAHTATARDVAFSPDGTQLASTSEDGTLRLWDLATGPHRLLARHTHGFRPAAWTRDGKTVIAGGFDGKLGRYDARTGRGRMVAAHATEIRCMAVSPDGAHVVIGDEHGKVVLWSSAGARIKELGEHVDVVRDVVFTPDGRHVLSAGGDRHVNVFELATGTRVRQLDGNEDGVNDLEISADGMRVASAGIDGTIRVWPLTGGTPRTLRGHGMEVKGVVLMPDGRIVSVSEDNFVRVWRLDQERPPTGVALRAWIDERTNVLVRDASPPDRRAD